MGRINKSGLLAGDTAPGFAMTDVNGNKVDLAHMQSNHVLLVFLRYAGCPWCNLTIHRLTLEYPLLAKQGCEVVAFVQSDNDSIRRNIYDRHDAKPPFPIIADPTMEIYEQYGVRPSLSAVAKSIKDIPYWMKSALRKGYPQTGIDGNMLLVPAMFLVAPKTGKIIQAEYASSFYDHESFTRIYEPLTFNNES